MPKDIRDADLKRWQGYLAPDGSLLKLLPLTSDEIKAQASGWIGSSVNPENPNMHNTIANVGDGSVVLTLRSGKRHAIPFREIIDADAVLRYWLARSKAPVSADFLRPDQEISEVQGTAIGNDSYAPALACRVRRQITGAFTSPDEISPDATHIEGAVSRAMVNAYERNPEARRECIAAHGTACCICGFSFGAVYGPEADGYIHVHHLRPLSEIGESYVVKPVEDLRPVCPNCHAVLHLGGLCRSIDEVRSLLSKRRQSEPGATADRGG